MEERTFYCDAGVLVRQQEFVNVTLDPGRPQFIPGETRYSLNGRPVSEAEAKQVLEGEHDEQRFTLTEARRLIAQENCAKQGHDVRVEFAMGSSDPCWAICGCCGRVWYVATKDEVMKRRAG